MIIISIATIVVDKRNASMLFVWYQICCNSLCLCVFLFCVRRQTSRRRYYRSPWNFHDRTCRYGSETRLLPFWGYPRWAPKSQILTAHISKMVSRSVTCPIGRNIGSTRAFQKCITWDGSPPGESPIRKMCIFARADRRELMHDARALFRMGFSTFGGGILKCLQILGGGQNIFLTIYLRHIASVTCVIYNCPLMCGRAIHQWILCLHGVVVVVGSRAIS